MRAKWSNARFQVRALLLVAAVLAALCGTSRADEQSDAYVEGLIRAFEQPPAAARELTLAQAIHTAVANNPGIRAQRLSPRGDRWLAVAAAAAYDPRLTLSAAATSARIPTANVLAGVAVGEREPLRRDEASADITLSKQFATGTAVDLSWRNVRRATNSAFQALVPEFEPQLGVTVTQPLLKNFGGISTRTAVETARNTGRRSAALFEAALSDFVASVIDAYWNLSEAQADLEVREHALALAKELVEEATARVRIGTLPPIAVREARADLAAREEEAIAARNRREVAARALQYLVMLADRPGGPPQPVRPVERHRVEERPIDKTASLRTALAKRAELRAARIDLENARAELRRARNELLPSLTLTGNYTLLGLGGIERPVEVPAGSGDVAVAALAASEPEAYGDALDTLVSRDFFRYSIALELEVPFSNAAARANYERAAVAVRAAKARLEQIVSDVALEIERAVADVTSATKRVFAARLARELAEENLRNQKKRYDVGMVTTTDVLRFQDKVVAAMAAEVRAVADHARAEARLARAEGTLLERYGIETESGQAPETPWWLRR